MTLIVSGGRDFACTHSCLDGEGVSGGRLKVQGPVDPEQHLISRVVHRPPEGPGNPVLLRSISRLDDVIHLQQEKARVDWLVKVRPPFVYTLSYHALFHTRTNQLRSQFLSPKPKVVCKD